MKPKYSLDIEICRDELEYLEGEIITKLVDRAQFALNRTIYEAEPNAMDEWLAELERPFAVMGRFTVAEERPFSHDLPEPQRRFTGDTGLPTTDFPVNLNEAIKIAYTAFLPKICQDGDDGHYGSSVEYDFMALRAISKRIHFGSYYIAAGKYESQPELFTEHIRNEDVDGIISALTFDKKEEEIVARIGAKTRTVQSAVHPFRSSWRELVDPETIVEFYRSTIIPLTKKGQAMFILAAYRD